MTFAVDWELEPPPSASRVARGTAWWGERLAAPAGGLCVTITGAVVVSEPDADRIRWIEPAAATTIGGAPGWRDGPPGQARFRHPLGVAAAADGSVIVADAGNHAIRRIDPDGQVVTLAGGPYGEADGPPSRARFRHPAGLAEAADGAIVVADALSNTIRLVGADHYVTTLAGSIYGQGDIEAGHPSFRRPEAVAVDRDGSVVVADTGNDRICRIDPSGRGTLVAGRRAAGRPAVAAADLRRPASLTLLPDGTLYVVDTGHGVVRRVRPDGTTGVVSSEPGWWPAAVAALPNGRLLAAETHWAPRRPIGRLRALPTT